MWKDVFRYECVDMPHKLSEEDILVDYEDVLKEEYSIVPRKEYAKVPSDECKNITVEDHSQELDICKWDIEDCWDNDLEAALGMLQA